MDGLDRETSRARLRDFLRDAVEKAGGPKVVALELSKLGFEGQGGAFEERTIRAWRTGGRMPAPDIVLALAARFSVSLDEYVFGEAPADLAAEADDLRRRQGILMGWLLELDDKLTERGLGLGLADRVSSLDEAPRERAG